MTPRSEGKLVRGSRAKPRRTQAERSAESDRRMLRAALKLIGERGYRGTSLAAIGEEAGYSRGLVNERFGSKSGLLWVLVKHMLRAWNDDGRAQQRASGHNGIEALFSRPVTAEDLAVGEARKREERIAAEQARAQRRERDRGR